MTDVNGNPIPTPADVAPAAPAPEPQEPAAASPEAATPPWGEDFDAEKAWNLVQNLRADKEKLSRRESLTPEQKQKLAEFDRLAEASKSELERAQEAAQKNSERAQALLDRAVRAEVKAFAAEGFADPEDAAAFLDLKSYTDESGDIDSTRIKDDLAALLSRKPHLGKSPTSRTPAPNPAQGSSANGPSGTRQLSREDIARMTPAQIDEAMRAGQFAHLLGQK